MERGASSSRAVCACTFLKQQQRALQDWHMCCNSQPGSSCQAGSGAKSGSSPGLMWNNEQESASSFCFYI